VHTLNVPGLCFRIWPDDGFFEPNHVAEFVILINIYIYIYIAVLLTEIYCYIKTEDGLKRKAETCSCHYFFKYHLAIYFAQ